jgi:hypothetical protein
MPLIETKGAASAQGFGEFAKVGVANYIEDCFSVYLYTGNGSTQTITNGIDLSGKGGLVWSKDRGQANNNVLQDTLRGVTSVLSSNLSNGDLGYTNNITAFNSTGYSIGGGSEVNRSTGPYVSWTFRKCPKFFDVVTYTGNGSNRTVAHNLGSVPGCIIVKRTDTSADWQVYHRSNANTEYMVLNSTAAKATGTTRWNSTTPTSTEFSLGTDTTVNASGATYVAYLFAHDAGGFGASGTDNVISCGSYTGNSTTNSINLGYEPQWLLIKRTTVAVSSWILLDVMRGLTVGTSDAALCPDNSNAEGATASVSNAIRPSATGFDLLNANSALNVSGSAYIYIAIRRGPMRTPTTGTSVYNAIARTGTGSVVTVTGVGFPPDLIHPQSRDSYGANAWYDKLRGGGRILFPSTTAAEGSDLSVGTFNQDGFSCTGGVADYSNFTGTPYINHFFRRAPGFFDVVCYTGTGVARTVNHNLGVVPELMIVKDRSAARGWVAYVAPLGAGKYLILNGTNAALTDVTMWNNTAPTSSVFSIGAPFDVNQSADTYVAYLFATVAGVSKVGSYTGTGTTLQVNCGFTGGARFVLIKRTDSTGDWYVWDSSRGIVAGNDPYLLLNSSAAEVTSTDYVDTFSSGFEISSTAPAAINANGGTFIFLAIA